MNIVVLDGNGVNPGDISWEPIAQYGNLKVYPRTSANDVLLHVGDAEIVLTNKTAFTAETIAKLSNVRYIGVLATGYNVVDLEIARKHGIVVTNIPAYSTDSVAQATFAHILNVTNSIAHYADDTRKGVWSSKQDFCYWDVPLVELAGKAIGIVGLGHIGRKVAQIAHSFGMHVQVCTSKSGNELPLYVKKMTMDELLSTSDIVTLHCPLVPETRELINAATLSKMRKGAVLVNTGRGPLVNEPDVAFALRSGQLGAYCADVMCAEPPSFDNPLLAEPHAYITPHTAWASMEARTRLMHVAELNIKSFLEGKPINVVNL